MEDELWRGLEEGVEQAQHADVRLLLVEALVVDLLIRLHGLQAQGDDRKISGRQLFKRLEKCLTFLSAENVNI